MHGRSAIWFPLMLLALLAALTWWIDRVVQPPQPKRDGSSRHDMDYKVSNFNTTKSDRYGNPRYVLAATELIHFPDDDSTQLTRPRFTQYSAKKPYTQIQAQRGQVSSNGENVYFMDNVKVVRGATPGRGELTVLTDYLHLIPDQDLAITDRPVSILQAPHTVVRGTGMEFNKKERTLKLFHQVRVHYEKPGANAPALAAPPPLKPAPTSQSGALGRQVAMGQAAKANNKAGGTQADPNKSVTSHPANQAGTRQPKTGNTTTRVRRHYEQAIR